MIVSGLKKMTSKYQHGPPWKKMKPPYQLEKDGFRISDLKKDCEGWVDSMVYLPANYDLVLMRTNVRTIAGWWNGMAWEGLHLRPADKIVCWKLKDRWDEWSKE